MFPEMLGGAKVLYYTPRDNFGEIFWDTGEIAHHINYLAICQYPGTENEYYFFRCDEQYEVVGDSLWTTVEECIGVANSSHGGQILWIKNSMS